MRLNIYLWKSAVIGSLGGLLFGFDTAVIAGVTGALRQTFHLNPAQLGLTVASALGGTVIGAMSTGLLGEKFGGRAVLRFMAALYLASALGCAIAWSWRALITFRFIGGLGIGGSSVLGPVYIAEIAPAKWRGRLVSMFQLNVVIGILLAYISNMCLALLPLGPGLWHWQLGVAALPSTAFLLLLFAIPHSSRWLVTQNRIDEARKVLQQVGSPNTEEELKEIIASIHLDRASMKERVFSRKYRFPIFLAVALGMFNQLSGINAILYYLNDIFFAAGFSRVSSDVQAVMIGAINLSATLAAISLIDRWGRKKLLAIGSVGMVACLVGIASLFAKHHHSVALLGYLAGFIVFFAFSQGSVVWVYLSEIFPTRVRSQGQSIGSSTHWITNAVIAAAFPSVAARSNACPFIFFALMMTLQLLLVLFVFPETKGATLEQIQAKLIPDLQER